MLRELFNLAELPSGRILFIHARLSNLHKLTGISYRALTQTVMDCLKDSNPTTVLVPAYTIYSFMMAGVYHRLHSRSEVGRFSEELRLNWTPRRTPDPMYSVLDLGDYLTHQEQLNYTKTFGANSLFEHLQEQNAIIINLDMDGFWSTQVHSVELRHKVDYRHEKSFKGIVYLNETEWHHTEYQAFVREMGEGLTQFPPYNQRRRKEFLQKAGVLKSIQVNGIDLSWLTSQDFVKEMDLALTKDRRFLVD